ncbi:MAG: hypothetical protein KDA49_03765, partial [Rhodospirillaceae bacterium]|nr:hypothetical protein [Rhodospirillaceae bacterium]
MRQSMRPTIVQLAGTIEEVQVGPCQQTRGPKATGVHVRLRTSERLVDLRLGPAEVLDGLPDRLLAGQKLSVSAFRREGLPDDAFMVQALTLGDETHVLRDETMRPVWAGR